MTRDWDLVAISFLCATRVWKLRPMRAAKEEEGVDPPTGPSPFTGAPVSLFCLYRTWPRVHHGPLKFLSARGGVEIVPFPAHLPPTPLCRDDAHTQAVRLNAAYSPYATTADPLELAAHKDRS